MGNYRGDRRRYATVSLGTGSDIVGRGVSGQQQERRKAAIGQNAQGEPMAATKTLSSGVGCLANQEQFLVRSLSSPGGPAWAASGHRGSGPYATRDLLSRVAAGLPVSGSGGRLFSPGQRR